jgi:hypothetical protein
MTSTESHTPRRSEVGWLVSPDLPSGVQLQISSLIEAENLTPEVIALLAKLMAELQQTAKVAAANPCPKLSTCQEFTGDCTKLEFCGTYKVKVVASL